MASLQSCISLPHIAIPTLVVLFLVALPLAALSQDPLTPGPTIADCSPRLMALVPCAPFVQGRLQMPGMGCCDNLRQLYSLQPGCVCLLLNDTTLNAFPINKTLAFRLPLLCNLHVNFSTCSGVPEPPSSSSSPISLETKNTSVAASPASPMVSPTVAVAPRPTSILGLGLGRSSTEKLKAEAGLAAALVVPILFTKLFY